MFLALKEMRKEKGRFILIIGIVALISYLVFFLTGLAYGLAKDNTLAVEDWNAKQIVLQDGTNSNIISSVLEKSVLDDFEGEDISPINISRAIAYKNGSKTEEDTINITLMGLEKESKAYPEIIEGKDSSSEDEVIASSTFRDEEGYKIGDKFVLSGNEREFTITGFTKESKFSVSPVVYTYLYEASQVSMQYNENTNDKEDKKGGATTSVPERFSGIIAHSELSKDYSENYDVLTTQEFIDKLPGYMAQVLTFGLMIGFLVLISSIVLGVFMYIITMQKKEVFGVLKVQGISNGYISKSVILQTFLISFIGLAIGFGLTIVSDTLLPSAVPFKSNYTFYAIVTGLILLISLLGAIFSVVGVSKVDPLEVLE